MRPSVLKPVAVLLVAVLLAFLGWWLPNRPVPLSNPFEGPIESVSFAPYRGNQSPLTGDYPSDKDIAAALDALAGKVQGVRLYTAREGMEQVPEMAKARGLKVFAGAWLGTVPRINQSEVAGLIDLANRYPDTIDRVIVGNEVLLRKDLSADQLIGFIRQVKAGVKQPVTYADVWEFWLKNPQVAQEVDFITVHILPYWEDNPLPIEQGNAHVDDILNQVHAAFPGKPVVIGEIGWPSHGRQREAAVAGRVELARFITEFLHKAKAEGIHYNVIEAFDQPWKSAQEGTVGANWGLFDADWQPKFDLRGPVVEEPRWLVGFGGAAVLAFLFLLLQRRRAAAMSTGRGLVAGAVLGLSAYAASRAGFEAWAYAYMPTPEAWAWVKAALCLGVATALVSAMFRMLADDRRVAIGGWVAAAGDIVLALAFALAFALGFLMVAGITDNVLMPLLPETTIARLWPLLPVDGRYRDFPTVYLGLAAVAPVIVALTAVLTGRDRLLDRLAFGRIFGSVERARPRGRSWFAALAALAFLALAAATMIEEGPLNTQAWVWSLCLILFSLPFGARLAPR